MNPGIDVNPGMVRNPGMDIMGASLIGSWVALCIYGATTTQMYIYWAHYPKDSLWKKALVVFLWTLNTLHTICVCIAVYTPVITLANLPLTWMKHGQAFSVAVLLHVPVTTTVAIFYTRIIYILSNKRWRWWLTGVIAITVAVSVAFGLDMGIRMIVSSDHMELYESIVTGTIIPAYIVQLVSDIFITASLCVLFCKQKTEFRRTRNILNRLIIYAASRGLVTLGTLLFLVMTVIISPGQLWSGAEFLVPGIYTSTLMVLLNARRYSLDIEEGSSSHETLPWSSNLVLATPEGSGPGIFNLANRTTSVEFRVTTLRTPEIANHDNHSQIFQTKVGVLPEEASADIAP